MSLILHPEHGVNPRLTYCHRCGGEGQELILLGNQDTKYTCQACGMVHFGKPSRKGHLGRPKCQGKDCDSMHFEKEPIGQNEKLPGGMCDACKKEVEEHEKIVAEGGIYWKCADCNRSGAIRANDFTKSMRAHMKIEPPDPLGVEFVQNPPEDKPFMECPVCGPNYAEEGSSDSA